MALGVKRVGLSPDLALLPSLTSSTGRLAGARLIPEQATAHWGMVALHFLLASQFPDFLTEEPLCARHTEAMCFTACDLHFVLSS